MPIGLPLLATTGVGSLPFTGGVFGERVKTFDLPWLAESRSEFFVSRSTRMIRSLRADLSGLEELPKGSVKLQFAGPETLALHGAMTPAEAISGLESVVRDACARVRSAGFAPVVFVDEPVLATSQGQSTVELLGRLRALEVPLGLHCCAQARWGEVLGWPVDYVGIDVELSLAAVTSRPEWTRFRSAGGALSLGVVPTTTPGAALPTAAALRERLERHLAPDVLRRCLLTTACGLALHDERSALERLSLVQAVQRELLSPSTSSRVALTADDVPSP